MDLLEIVKDLVPMVIGLVGGGTGIYFWSVSKQQKKAEADKSTTEARRAEADLAETILEKYEKAILARMDSSETVQRKELDALRTDLGGQLSNIQVENRKQNETIAAQNEQISTISELLQDMKEYLNGGFAEFEERKSRGTKKGK